MILVSVLSQKGGVGKSTLVRALATEYAVNEWSVKIADMDLKQKTCTDWNCTRLDNEVIPEIEVQPYKEITKVITTSKDNDIVFVDGAGQADESTFEIAKKTDLLILPSGVSMDDLIPQIKLAHELRKKGIQKTKILFLLSRVSSSANELKIAEEEIIDSGYTYLGFIPDKTSITQAQNKGLSATETDFKSVNDSVSKTIQNIMNLVNEL